MPSASNCRGFLFTYNFKQRFFACFTKHGDAFYRGFFPRYDIVARF